MKVNARLEFKGECYMLSRFDDVPEEGVAIRHDSESPMRLYIDGADVGYVIDWPLTEMEMIYVQGEEAPVGAVPSGTTIDAVLELGKTDG